MLAIAYQEVAEEIHRTQFTVVPEKPIDDYARLVTEFEKTAEVLLERVTELLSDAYDYHKVIARPAWQQEALFLAGELDRYPWLLVNLACPPKYETLKRFYEDWAWNCRDLARGLRTLGHDEDNNRGIVRIWDADAELSAVEASTFARQIYLESLEEK